MAKELHLTSGNIPSQMFRLYLPLLFANVLQQLYNVINALIVSRFISDQAFAALGVAESIMNLYAFAILGACTGAGVLVAQSYGHGDFDHLRQQLFASAVLIGSIVLGAVALGLLFLPQLLGLLHTPEELMAEASAYLWVVLPGMLFTFAYHFLASALRAVGDTKAALYFLLLSLGYNLVCAWFLVVVLELGIVGAGLATASAQLLSASLCLVYIRKKRAFLWLQRKDMHMGRSLRRVSSFAAASALQQSSLYLGKLLVQGSVNDLGTAAIAAFAAGCRADNFGQGFSVSGSDAISIFIAQNRGAGRKNRMMQCFRIGTGMNFVLVLLITLGMGFFARPIGQLFLGGSEGLELCTGYLQMLSFFYLLTFIGNSFSGWFRGNGHMAISFWITTSQIVVRVIGTWLLAPRMGLNAVALSTGLGWVVMAALMLLFFFLVRRKDLI